MNRVPCLMSRSLAAVCLLALVACQSASPGGPGASGTGVQVAGSQNAGTAGFSTVPQCASGIGAKLAGGVTLSYVGSDPRDVDLCLLHWSGRSHPLYFGFWSATSASEMTDEARQAFRSALTGPVGTETAFEAQHARLWSRVTITHVSNTTVAVAGESRAALEFQVVQHDAQGRPRVRSETRHWVDRETGIMLKQQSVTHRADGGLTTTTTWQVASLQSPG